jgi:hypothetical protein
MGRLFGFVGTVATLAIGMYIYSLQIKAMGPTAASGNPVEAATIVGVKNDLLAIANAERGYIGVEGRYDSLEELTSGNYVTIQHERPPYIYDVEVSPGSFRATATRTTKGAPAQVWVTETMEVQSSN